MNRPVLLLVLVCVVIASAIYVWQREGDDRQPSRPAGSGRSDTGGSAVTGIGHQGKPDRSSLPPRRLPPDVAPQTADGASGKRRPLVGLFDTARLCEQHNATHCQELRDATARCDSGDVAGCRAALARVDTGPLRDISLARVFAQRVCEVGGDCVRARALDQFKRAEADRDARAATIAACQASDAVACGYAARAATDKAESDRYAELACKGGVIGLGGCFDVGTPVEPTPVLRAALEHACRSESADGCDLLGRLLFDIGELDAARTALARGCELAPGGDTCIALDALLQTGTPNTQ